MRIGQIGELVRALQVARGAGGAERTSDTPWGGVLFLIGAGCSRSAGVPLAVEIAQEQALHLARSFSNGTFMSDDADAAKAWLHANVEEDFPSTLSWSEFYGRVFERHVSDYALQGRVIRRAIARGSRLNWAHLCLGELVREHYVHTVLTTNFDQLALGGIIRSGLLPVVADGIEALTRIDGRPTQPQVVHLHGSGHAYRLRNTTEDIAALENDGAVIRSVGDLLRDSPALVIVGYAGEERGLMKVLTKATEEFGRKRIFWVQYDPNPDKLAPAAAELLARGGTLIIGGDADLFFAETMRGLNHSVPEWMRDPVGTLQSVIPQVVVPASTAVERELAAYRQRVTALGASDRQWLTDRTEFERTASLFREEFLAGRFREAVTTIAPEVGELDDEDLAVYVNAAYHAGMNETDPALLEEAIAAGKRLLGRLDASVSQVRRAEIQHLVGNALTTLGGRGNNPARIGEALEMYDAAMEVRTREAAPYAWAATLNSLGGALEALGRREASPARLEAAERAYEQALTVFTREARPLQWALTQTNRANVLQFLGQRDVDDTRLKQAVDGYRAALEVRTRQTLPKEWATTQNSLGSALRILGEREEGLERLQQALEAFREILQVRTRDALPIRWALTQNNIGIVLRILGERERNRERLQEAVKAHEAALEVNNPDQLPVPWAETQSGLGLALESLGELDGNVAHLEAAIRSYDLALAVRTRERMPFLWAITTYNRAIALQALAALEHSADRFGAAAAAFRDALGVSEAFSPTDLTDIQSRLQACETAAQAQ